MDNAKVQLVNLRIIKVRILKVHQPQLMQESYENFKHCCAKFVNITTGFRSILAFITCNTSAAKN